jgi:SAM-dependent methyltransferase
MAVQKAMPKGIGRDRGAGNIAPDVPESGCPACAQLSLAEPREKYGKYDLFECRACGLQYWLPPRMPDASWYEQMYSGRDQEVLPLEPGHNYFLADPLAPGKGALLDIGCGTGNFLAAARANGYEVSGIELDREAARFARKQLALEHIYPVTIGDFAEKWNQDRFDVVTFFEVLEHQAAPREFLENAKKCLKPQGTIALSVPNRERWLTGPDVLDYPPNHFLRWNAAALRKFLQAEGFEVLSIKQQPAGMVHTAQMLNMRFRTGLSRTEPDPSSASFRDLMQMSREEAGKVLASKPSLRQKVIEILGTIKYAACFPLAVAAYPYVRMRGYKGTYLYCLAKLCD